MKTIYTAIITQLKTKVPSLKWIDLDTGQLDAPIRPSINWPAVLIGIDMPNSKNIDSGGKSQDCKARITANIAFNNTPDRTSANAPNDVRNANLKVYDTISDVYAALQGFETESFNSLERKSQGKIQRKDDVFLYRIVFECDFEDITA